ncbi:hypothetical protein [Convivina intestini]|nr:hypothetical protein [Convivina intestini]
MKYESNVKRDIFGSLLNGFSKLNMAGNIGSIQTKNVFVGSEYDDKKAISSDWNAVGNSLRASINLVVGHESK